MSSVAAVPILNTTRSVVVTRNPNNFHPEFARTHKQFPVIHSSGPLKIGGSIPSFGSTGFQPITACSNTSVADPAVVSEPTEKGVVVYTETFPLKRAKTIEGKIYTRMDHGSKEGEWQLTVGCNLPGKWILHWGVQYIGDVGSEWDQPPRRMRPPGSVAIKDYAIETPLKEVASSKGGECNHEVKIQCNSKYPIAAINFLLKDAETGSWYQHKGRDYKVLLADHLRDGDEILGDRKSFSLWPGVLGQLSTMLLKTEDPGTKSIDGSEQAGESLYPKIPLEGLYEEQQMVKEVPLDNSISVTVRKCPDTAKHYVFFETDIPEDVVIHWGVCKDDKKIWKIPAGPHPPDTEAFKNKALRTKLQPKEDGSGGAAIFTLDESLAGLLFVLKLDNETWLNCMGHDFFVPLSSPTSLPDQSGAEKSDSRGLNKSTEGSLESGDLPETTKEVKLEGLPTENSDGNGIITMLESGDLPETTIEVKQEGPPTEYSDEIITEIRNLVNDISSENMWKSKSAEAQETILQEIEKLAAEAYSIFRSSLPSYAEETVAAPEEVKTSVMISSGTGSGYEILCQGFNWESHKSGRWYMELSEKAAELSSLGFTVIWLPPPTESISPEGYMPKDLYNLNSRYGSVDELKAVVNKFHQVGIKVLGDAVLNHRCAHFQNQNGVWNIFGGRLNWDDRAVVADDPHFQGRGNKSSGDNFHAAPNIDHSQDFVRKDLKEWLCWLRKDIGYDGWRLDFVRGFWGGYVKDYIDASEPYFAVGEYWDSLSYTYNEMDYNQDAHRQRIVDWINATGGTAGAFDVTTKGILHAALERCEYWRLSDAKGKPPGVVGWWPSRAVTFIENHDTGSTQGHWRFPGGKEMQGYAYILTHPGTPTVFYDHIFSHTKSDITKLISLRRKNKLHCRSTLKITKAERDVYAAVIDDKVAMKIGPGHYEPPHGKNWSVAIEGNSYKVWEAL